jgi:hypothetical protein
MMQSLYNWLFGFSDHHICKQVYGIGNVITECQFPDDPAKEATLEILNTYGQELTSDYSVKVTIRNSKCSEKNLKKIFSHIPKVCECIITDNIRGCNTIPAIEHFVECMKSHQIPRQ